MALEIERKFIVNPLKLPKELPNPKIIHSGYFTKESFAVRVTSSIKHDGTEAHKICIKSPGGEIRHEFEYTIPKKDVGELLLMAPAGLIKKRYEFDGWEVDEFEGFIPHPQLANQKLWLAEWETHEGKDQIPKNLPSWILYEVTKDVRYSNQSLAWEFGKRASRNVF